MAIDIKEMTIDQLKAMAYDQIATAEQCRVNIQALQAEIQSRSNRAMPAAPLVVEPAPAETK